MSMLEDGTVAPSFLNVESCGFNGNYDIPSNFSLRFGEVKEILLPNSNIDPPRRFIEYKVEVQHCDGASGGNSSIYTSVALSNLFGGTADFIRYTLRPDSNPNPDEGFGTGSKVLLLCVNGQDSNAVILGGLDDTYNDNTKHPSDQGHHYLFQFNGCSFEVNDSGEVTLQYKGKTKVNGELHDSADPEASGSKIVLDKEGSITLTTKDDLELLKIDHKSNKIELNVQNGGNIVMKSGGVLVGDAQENWLLAKTYREKESQMHQTLADQLQSIAQDLMQVSIKLGTAGTMQAYPIVGAVSAAPMIASAAMSIGSTVAKFMAAVAAIKQFEAQATTYLSTKNFND